MSYTPQNAWDISPQTGLTTNPGPFLGEVMRNNDPLRSARLLVYIPDMGGDPELESSWHLCRYMSPFYGIQPLSNRLAADPAPPESLQSYGMWMTPPDVGVKVLVMFINGDRSRGVWIGCLPEIGSHGAVPGQDAGDFDVFANYNASNSDIASIPRPPHSTAPTFETQGLADDTARGPITSSSLRESPSQVFGFNTPGSHSFVMDDGDTSGANRLVRIRTASGNQIMMNDDNGFIYFINAAGTGWLELSPDGQVDVYGQSGINLATPGSINLHADQDINMHANNNIKIVAGVGAKIQGTEEMQVHGRKLFLQGIDSIEQHSCGKIKITGNSGIDMFSCANFILQGRCFKWNSASAQEAEQVPPEEPTTVSGYNTTVTRAPSQEPYDGHGGSGSATGPGSSGATRITESEDARAALTDSTGTVDPGLAAAAGLTPPLLRTTGTTSTTGIVDPGLAAAAGLTPPLLRTTPDRLPETQTTISGLPPLPTVSSPPDAPLGASDTQIPRTTPRAPLGQGPRPAPTIPSPAVPGGSLVAPAPPTTSGTRSFNNLGEAFLASGSGELSVGDEIRIGGQPVVVDSIGGTLFFVNPDGSPFQQ